MSKSKAMQDFHNLIAGFGCVVCRGIKVDWRINYQVHANYPAQVHHIQLPKRKEWAVIPLCLDHHTGHFSIHKTKARFRVQVGHEWDLFFKVRERMHNWPEEVDRLALEYINSGHAPPELIEVESENWLKNYIVSGRLPKEGS